MEARELRSLLSWLVVGEQPVDGSVRCCSSKLFFPRVVGTFMCETKG